MQKYFFQFKLKGKEGWSVFPICHIIQKKKIADIIEMIKKELFEVKLYMEPQAVTHWDITTTS